MLGNHVYLSYDYHLTCLQTKLQYFIFPLNFPSFKHVLKESVHQALSYFELTYITCLIITHRGQQLPEGVVRMFSELSHRTTGNGCFWKRLIISFSFQLKGASAAQYKGLLVKLKLRCTEKKAAKVIVRDSCIVFKLLGTKSCK